MIRRSPTSDREGGIVEVARGRARRSWGILDGRVGADGLWILPEAWKTLHHRLIGPVPRGPRFPPLLGRRERRPQAPQAQSLPLSLKGESDVRFTTVTR